MITASLIIETVRTVSGNMTPHCIVSGTPCFLPSKFSVLNLSTHKFETFRDLGAASIDTEPDDVYDVIVCDRLDCAVNLRKLLSPLGKVCFVCPTTEVRTSVSWFGNHGMYWIDWKQDGPDSLIVFRQYREMIRPLWDGKKKGTILLHCEWGWGDCIQNLRYLKHVKELCGGKVIFEARQGIEQLVADTNLVDQVVIKGNPLPLHDFHIEMGFLHNTLGIVPTDPYITAPRRPAWPKSKRMRVGLVWKGHHLTLTPFKFANPSAFSELENNAIEFYSLQKFSCDEQRTLPDFVRDISSELNNWSDTAHAISQMDLMVSIDTSVAHLAGAMGKRTWALLPKQIYNTPLIENASWYPSIELIKNDRHDDWTETLRMVSRRLCEESKRRLLIL